MFQGLALNSENYMSLLSARQKLVASNVANADTPGYRTQDIDFQFEFASLVKGQSPQTITAPKLKLVQQAIQGGGAWACSRRFMSARRGCPPRGPGPRCWWKIWPTPKPRAR